MKCVFIKHHCTRVETVTPEQEEGEPVIAGDDTPVETQGRHLNILTPYFGSMMYMCLVCA